MGEKNREGEIENISVVSVCDDDNGNDDDVDVDDSSGDDVKGRKLVGCLTSCLISYGNISVFKKNFFNFCQPEIDELVDKADDQSVGPLAR